MFKNQTMKVHTTYRKGSVEGGGEFSSVGNYVIRRKYKSCVKKSDYEVQDMEKRA